MLRRFFFIIVSLLLGVVGIAAAQSADCPALVEEALTTVGEMCTGLGRNEVCYGSNQVTAFDANAKPLQDFSQSGDIEKVTNVHSLTTAGLDVEKQTWGVALMSLQANIPDTLPGQAVTFLVFGDSTVTAAPEDVEEGLDAPMQAIRIATGIGAPKCAEAPRDGILVQTPGGAKVNFRVNGIDIEMGSTVILDVRKDEKVWVSTLEGEAKVTSNGVTETALPGYKVVTIPGQDPAAPEPYTFEEVADMPVSLLPQEVAIPFIVPVTATEWIDSDFAVEAGQTYRVDVDEFDPEDAFTGTLMARVGEEGEPFEVSDEFTPEADGVLQFSVVGDSEPEKVAYIVVVEPVESE